MSRSGVSAADQELDAFAASRGFKDTARRIERWRAQGLLPANRRRSRGRGRGTTSESAPGARELVVWLAEHARPGRRPGDLALLAFGADLSVPEATVRSAFDQSVDRVQLSVERDMPPGSTPEEIADAAVKAGVRATMVPARVRRIDETLAQLGVTWASTELAAFDPGPDSTPATASDWTHMAVQTMLAGGGTIDLGMLGALARAVLPAGSAAPVSAQMEYHWPGNENDADYLLNEDGGLAFLPIGDLRDHIRALAASTPLHELRDAWRMAAQMPEWATTLCDTVEREAAEHRPGEAMKEWFFGAFGPPRLILATALRDRNCRPADTAVTALILIFIRSMIRKLRQLLPTGQFDLLRHPLLTPPFLVSFMDG